MVRVGLEYISKPLMSQHHVENQEKPAYDIAYATPCMIPRDKKPNEWEEEKSIKVL